MTKPKSNPETPNRKLRRASKRTSNRNTPTISQPVKVPPPPRPVLGTTVGATASGGSTSVGGARERAASTRDVDPGGSDTERIWGEGAAALLRLAGELKAMPSERSRHINVYVPAAGAIVLGALPRLLTLRDAMLALPDNPVAALDRLRDCTLAVLYAHALTLPRDEGATRVRALLEEATPMRERLLSGAELLVRYELVDATLVAAIRRGTGHLDTAQDLSALAALFQSVWPQVSSKVPTTLAEVERAAELGILIIEALGQRDQGTDGSSDPNADEDRLARAYELFVTTYDACRHAVMYLRWRQGDADTFAPALIQNRRRSRSPSTDEPGDEGADDSSDGAPDEVESI